jgi:hypothetical protein
MEVFYMSTFLSMPQRWKGKVIGGILGFAAGTTFWLSWHGSWDWSLLKGPLGCMIYGIIIGGVLEWLISKSSLPKMSKE